MITFPGSYPLQIILPPADNIPKSTESEPEQLVPAVLTLRPNFKGHTGAPALLLLH